MEITETRLHDHIFGVSKQVREMGVSRASLYREIKAAYHIPASRFIWQMRLKRTHEILAQKQASITHTAFQCGFGSVTYFDKCFRDYNGFSPAHARNRDSTLPKSKTPKKPGTQKKIFMLTKGRNKIQSFLKLFQNAAT